MIPPLVLILRWPLTCFRSLQVNMHFLYFDVNKIIQYVFFFFWLLSLSIIIFRLMYIVATINGLFLRTGECYSTGRSAAHCQWALGLSTVRLLHIKLPRTDEPVCEQEPSLLWGKYLGLHHTSHACLLCEVTANLFSGYPPAGVKDSPLPAVQTVCFASFLSFSFSVTVTF